MPGGPRGPLSGDWRSPHQVGGRPPGNTLCPLLQGFDTDRRGSFLMSRMKTNLQWGNGVSASFGHVLND